MCYVVGIVDDGKSDVVCAFVKDVDECMEEVEDVPGDEGNNV